MNNRDNQHILPPVLLNRQTAITLIIELPLMTRHNVDTTNRTKRFNNHREEKTMKVTKIVTKVMTVAIAVMMIAGTTSLAAELPCNTRTNDECNEYTLLALNTSSDGNGSAGGQGDVHWQVQVGASSNAPATQVAGASRNTVDGFVDRLYSNTLHRSADAAGRAYWVDLLSSKKVSGSEAANGFFTSQEFLNLNLNNEQFVSTLYTVFFGRTPDQAGLNYWVAQLNNGTTRAQVISGFTGSAEWTGICSQYGINA